MFMNFGSNLGNVLTRFLFSWVTFMKELEKKILEEGHVYPGGVLKVDSFLNHQLDTMFIMKMGAYIADKFSACEVTKVLTVEASGIALAMAVAYKLVVPVVFAKKQKTSNMSDDYYSAQVHSFTHNTENTVIISREYIQKNDVVLIVDDFLAEGNAMKGLLQIAQKAGSKVAGCSAAIEKGFQGGGDALRHAGIHVLSLAIIDNMDNGILTFRDNCD